MTTQSERGTILGMTMVFAITLAVVALSVLSLALGTYRLTMRNEEIAKARSVAESELEALYYQYNFQMVDNGLSVEVVPALLPVDIGARPTTFRDPFLQAHQVEGWRVRRSISVSPRSAGMLENTTLRGNFTNVDMKVEVLPPLSSPWATESVRMGCGRVIVSSTATIFQSCVFYQGMDVYLANSGRVTFDGDITCNGGIYMGSGSGGTLEITGSVTYLANHGFNTDPGLDDDFTTTADNIYTTRKPGTSVLTGGTLSELAAPVFSVSQAEQLKVMAAPQNLLGGVDVGAIQLNNPDLFPSVNDVYRSLIAPPPSAGNTNEYTTAGLAAADDVAIHAQRAYVKAGVIITVNTDNSITITDQSGTALRNSSGMALTDASVGLISPSKSVYDQREKVDVKVTDIDLSKLKDLIGPGTANPTFNGVVYVNQKSGGVLDGTNPPSAVRLINATETPRSLDTTTSNPTNGFSMATNGALYIQGSYNTVEVTNTDGSNPTINPAMLMADTVTVLSDAWNDAKASADATQRVARSNYIDPVTGHPTTTINTGIVAGNTRAADGMADDGVQNLVRYEENWNDDTLQNEVKFNGAICRLFDSKMFTAPYVDPFDCNGEIYQPPKLRAFTFNSKLLDKSPPGSPETVSLRRNRFYFW